MTWNRARNDWKQAGDRIKLTWGKLSEADIAAINGSREKLSTMLQDRYKFTEARVDEMISQFSAGLTMA